jgi:hypothetical protein
MRDLLAKAQLQNYEGHRAMMEAYGLDKYNTATGVVQWMLSNPWAQFDLAYLCIIISILPVLISE